MYPNTQQQKTHEATALNTWNICNPNSQHTDWITLKFKPWYSFIFIHFPLPICQLNKTNPNIPSCNPHIPTPQTYLSSYYTPLQFTYTHIFYSPMKPQSIPYFSTDNNPVNHFDKPRNLSILRHTLKQKEQTTKNSKNNTTKSITELCRTE